MKDSYDKVVDKMSDSKIEEMYDEALRRGDELFNSLEKENENGHTLTEAEVIKLKDFTNSVKSDDAKFLESLPSNNGIDEATDNEMEDIVKQTMVEIDPNSGSMRLTGHDDINEEMNRLMDIDIEDLYNLPKSSADIPYDPELVIANAGGYGLVGSDIEKILPLIDRYRNGEKCNWFEEMPKTIKDIINQQCASVNNYERSTRKMFAEELIRGLIRDAGIDRLTIDLQQATEEAFDMSGIMKMTLDYQSTLLETKFTDMAEKLEENEEFEKAKTIRAVSEKYKESYTYEGFIDAANRGRLRVKPFDITKYNRYVSEFNFKYKKDTPFVINDISMIVPILKRKFKQYSQGHLVSFVIAICKYCGNMDAKDVKDHTYMSYLIINILNLDLITKGQEEHAFTNTLLENIETAIKAVNKL